MRQLILKNLFDVRLFFFGKIAANQTEGLDVRRKIMTFERRNARDVNRIVAFWNAQDLVAGFIQKDIVVAENGMNSKTGKGPDFVLGIGKDGDSQARACGENLLDVVCERNGVFKGFPFPAKLEKNMDGFRRAFFKNLQEPIAGTRKIEVV